MFFLDVVGLMDNNDFVYVPFATKSRPYWKQKPQETGFMVFPPSVSLYQHSFLSAMTTRNKHMTEECL